MKIKSDRENYTLSKCVEKFVRINKADFALAYIVDEGGENHQLNQETEVFIDKNNIFQGRDRLNFIDHIKQYVLSKDIQTHEYFLQGENHASESIFDSRKNINNIRYIPIKEDSRIYCIVVLINIQFSYSSQSLPDISPFVLASISLLKTHQQQIEAQSFRITKSKQITDNDQLIQSLLKYTFHPTIIFNDEFKVLQVNAASQRLVNSNIQRGWPAIDKLITKLMPDVAAQILTSIKMFSFLGHLNKEEWFDIELHYNPYQSVTVDIHLFIVKYQEEQCFTLMLNENSNTTSTKNYHASLQRFNALTSVVPMAILQVDKNWNCSYINETWSRYTGQNIEQSSQKGWLNCMHDYDIKTVLPAINKVASHSKHYSNKVQLKKSDNTNLWVSINAIGLFNNKYELTGFILTIHDISDSYLYAEKLERMANYDHLTGLSNRAFFTDRLNIALSRSKRHGMTALMFLDLDKFKNINDTLGHPIGDKVIQEVASRLAATVRGEDSIARLGGDEFSIIFTDIKAVSALVPIAEKIVEAINRPFEYEGHQISMSCSIGIATTSDENNTHTTTEMLNKADLALYKAKDLGRNQFYFYDSELEYKTTVLNCLKDSLNNTALNEFSLFFQPQIDPRTQKILGFEALTRWDNALLGKVIPDIFIRIIEDNNLIYDFSVWLFSEVIRIAKSWIETGIIDEGQRIAINLSAKQLHINGFSDYVIDLFNENKISPKWFTLEVTETAYIEDPIMAGNNLKSLQDLGFFIALDDFGTGYSSLSLLRQMPLDYIKIDRSFVSDVLEDKSATNIVEAIIELCRKLELTVIAEGVENQETQQWLISHDCFNHQGFYFSKPLNEKNAKKLSLKNKQC